MTTLNLQYVTGDATVVAPGGNRIIAHICNDGGGWGRGFGYFSQMART
jgi:hypothetical protein